MPNVTRLKMTPRGQARLTRRGILLPGVVGDASMLTARNIVAHNERGEILVISSRGDKLILVNGAEGEAARAGSHDDHVRAEHARTGGASVVDTSTFGVLLFGLSDEDMTRGWRTDGVIPRLQVWAAAALGSVAVAALQAAKIAIPTTTRTYHPTPGSLGIDVYGAWWIVWPDGTCRTHEHTNEDSKHETSYRVAEVVIGLDSGACAALYYVQRGNSERIGEVLRQEQERIARGEIRPAAAPPTRLIPVNAGDITCPPVVTEILRTLNVDSNRPPHFRDPERYFPPGLYIELGSDGAPLLLAVRGDVQTARYTERSGRVQGTWHAFGEMARTSKPVWRVCDFPASAIGGFEKGAGSLVDLAYSVVRHSATVAEMSAAFATLRTWLDKSVSKVNVDDTLKWIESGYTGFAELYTCSETNRVTWVWGGRQVCVNEKVRPGHRVKVIERFTEHAADLAAWSRLSRAPAPLLRTWAGIASPTDRAPFLRDNIRGEFDIECRGACSKAVVQLENGFGAGDVLAFNAPSAIRGVDCDGVLWDRHGVSTATLLSPSNTCISGARTWESNVATVVGVIWIPPGQAHSAHAERARQTWRMEAAANVRKYAAGRVFIPSYMPEIGELLS